MSNTYTPDTDETGSRESIKHRLQGIADDATEMARSTQRAGVDQMAQARERIRPQLQRARDGLTRMERGAVERARVAARATDGAVHDHPYLAIGIAAGIGALVGLLLARRDY